MDKTERLFSIMDALRRHRRPVTAAALAEEQGVSVRTLYRDVQTLIGLGAPIDGEAVRAIIVKMAATPRAVIGRYNQITGVMT